MWMCSTLETDQIRLAESGGYPPADQADADHGSEVRFDPP